MLKALYGLYRPTVDLTFIHNRSKEFSMPRIGDNPKLNLQAFEKLARSKGADNSQLRVANDGSIKARSAFASRVVNFFRSSNAIEATNREVAEANTLRTAVFQVTRGSNKRESLVGIVGEFGQCSDGTH
jgi:hypothetical protein